MAKKVAKKEVVTYNQTQFIEKVLEVAGENAKPETIVKTTIETIMNILAEGDKITLPGFGGFEVRERAAREGRNPKTGETIKIAATRVPAFKAGKTFKARVNEGQPVWGSKSEKKSQPKVADVEVTKVADKSVKLKRDKKKGKK